jgi:hypothetical protein
VPLLGEGGREGAQLVVWPRSGAAFVGPAAAGDDVADVLTSSLTVGGVVICRVEEDDGRWAVVWHGADGGERRSPTFRQRDDAEEAARRMMRGAAPAFAAPWYGVLSPDAPGRRYHDRSPRRAGRWLVVMTEHGLRYAEGFGRIAFWGWGRPLSDVSVFDTQGEAQRACEYANELMFAGGIPPTRAGGRQPSGPTTERGRRRAARRAKLRQEADAERRRLEERQRRLESDPELRSLIEEQERLHAELVEWLAQEVEPFELPVLDHERRSETDRSSD